MSTRRKVAGGHDADSYKGEKRDVVAARLRRRGPRTRPGPRRRVVVEHLDAGASSQRARAASRPAAEDAHNVFERVGARADATARFVIAAHASRSIRGREDQVAGGWRATRRQRRRRAGPLVDDGLVCRRARRAARGRAAAARRRRTRRPLRDSGKPRVEGRRRLRVLRKRRSTRTLARATGPPRAAQRDVAGASRSAATRASSASARALPRVARTATARRRARHAPAEERAARRLGGRRVGPRLGVELWARQRAPARCARAYRAAGVREKTRRQPPGAFVVGGVFTMR